MTLYFITSNKNKFSEAKAILGNIEQLDISLPEIQGMDPREIIKAKLKEAFNHHPGPFIVDDTSLCLECINGLPGPLIKWFLETLGREGIANLAERMGNTKAEARCMVGYAKSPREIQFFEGVVKGTIVHPRGTTFGWDPIFQPDGYFKTYAELTREDKNSISHRRKALEKLKAFLLA